MLKSSHLKVFSRSALTFQKRQYSAARCSGISVISVPFDGGQPRKGTSQGPKFLLDGGITSQFKNLIKNEETLSLGSFKVPASVETCSSVSRALSEAVHRESRKGLFCLTLGGDHSYTHSIATGTVHGLLKTYNDLCVIWVDAHPDINTYERSQSKNVHGMPLSFVVQGGVLEASQPEAYSWIALTERLPTNRLAYLGIRDVDEFERTHIRESTIPSWSSLAIRELGITETVKQILQKINPKPIHVSFDVDSLDPAYAPSTGTPVEGGLTLMEAQTLGHLLHQTNNLVGMDIVEVNPMIGDPEDTQTTLHATKETVEAFLLGARGTQHASTHS